MLWITFCYSTISIKQGFVTPPKYPSGGIYVLSWTETLGQQYDLAWMSTPRDINQGGLSFSSGGVASHWAVYAYYSQRPVLF